MLLSRMFTIFSPVFLLFLFLLAACGDQPINLNQVITKEITTEPVNQQGIEQSPQSDNLWLVTDVIQQKEELHGQIVSVVGYVGWQGEQYNEWFVNLWNEPIGNYEDMWKDGKKKETENTIEKWNVCWTDCWEIGQDYATIRFPSSYPRFRAPELTDPELRPNSLPDFDLETPKLTDPDPNLLFDGNLQAEPKTKLKSLDKYILKVLVRDWGPGAGLTLVEIIDHIEMPKEQPPPSINEDNPITVKEFKEQWENFYDQTVSVRGYAGDFGTDALTGLDSFGFHHDKNKDYKEMISISVNYPYGERVYFWKMAYQGLRQGGPYIIRIRVHSPETNTIRGQLWGSDKTFQELYPFVILWVDGDREKNLSKAHSWW